MDAQAADVLSKIVQNQNLREVMDEDSQFYPNQITLSPEVRLTTLDPSKICKSGKLVLQVLEAVNTGVSQQVQRKAKEENQQEDEEEGEEKFESIYLDAALAKEEKKVNLESQRIMRLTLTDGRNEFSGFEYRKVNFFQEIKAGDLISVHLPQTNSQNK